MRYTLRLMLLALTTLSLLWQSSAMADDEREVTLEERQVTLEERKAWQDLDEGAREKLREQYRAFKKLRDSEKDELRKRLKAFSKLKEKQQKKIRRQFRKFQRLGDRERHRVSRFMRRFEDIGDKQRNRMRDQLVSMSKKMRARFLKNIRRWRNLTERQQTLARKRLQRCLRNPECVSRLRRLKRLQTDQPTTDLNSGGSTGGSTTNLAR